MSANPLALPHAPSGRRRYLVRAATVSMRRASKRALAAEAERYPERPGVDYQRPRTWADCEAAELGASVPCPFVSCAHHLALDVSERTGSIKANFPDRGVDEAPHTCALRVADQGGITLEEVAAAMNLTRERIRQIEIGALAKLAGALGPEALRDLVDASDERCARIDAGSARFAAVEPAVAARGYAPPVRAGEVADEVETPERGRIW